MGLRDRAVRIGNGGFFVSARWKRLNPVERTYRSKSVLTVRPVQSGQFFISQRKWSRRQKGDPQLHMFGILPRYRLVQRVNRLLKSDTDIISDNVSLLIKLSAYDGGLSYRLPDHAKHLQSIEW